MKERKGQRRIQNVIFTFDTILSVHNRIPCDSEIQLFFLFFFFFTTGSLTGPS